MKKKKKNRMETLNSSSIGLITLKAEQGMSEDVKWLAYGTANPFLSVF